MAPERDVARAASLCRAGGANLAELALRDKVDLAGEQDPGRPGRIIVRDPSPAGDPILDAALQTVTAYQGKKPSTVIRPLSKNRGGHCTSGWRSHVRLRLISALVPLVTRLG